VEHASYRSCAVTGAARQANRLQHITAHHKRTQEPVLLHQAAGTGLHMRSLSTAKPPCMQRFEQRWPSWPQRGTEGAHLRSKAAPPALWGSFWPRASAAAASLRRTPHSPRTHTAAHVAAGISCHSRCTVQLVPLVHLDFYLGSTRHATHSVWHAHGEKQGVKRTLKSPPGTEVTSSDGCVISRLPGLSRSPTHFWHA